MKHLKTTLKQNNVTTKWLALTILSPWELPYRHQSGEVGPSFDCVRRVFPASVRLAADDFQPEYQSAGATNRQWSASVSGAAFRSYRLLFILRQSGVSKWPGNASRTWSLYNIAEWHYAGHGEHWSQPRWVWASTMGWAPPSLSLCLSVSLKSRACKGFLHSLTVCILYIAVMHVWDKLDALHLAVMCFYYISDILDKINDDVINNEAVSLSPQYHHRRHHLWSLSMYISRGSGIIRHTCLIHC